MYPTCMLKCVGSHYGLHQYLDVDHIWHVGIQISKSPNNNPLQHEMLAQELYTIKQLVASAQFTHTVMA